MTAAEPAGPDVLADLLALASERGPETLVTTDALLRDLAGDEAVNIAHAVWTHRLKAGLLSGRGAPAREEPEAPGEDVFDLTRRLHANTSVRHRRRARL